MKKQPPAFLERGRLVISNPMRAVALIWQAMMRAKKSGG